MHTDNQPERQRQKTLIKRDKQKHTPTGTQADVQKEGLKDGEGDRDRKRQTKETG